MNRISSIDAVKAFAIFTVILLHVIAPTLAVHPSARPIAWWSVDVIDSFTRVGVPLFIMASGATILYAEKTKNISVFLSKRLQKVLVPFIAWSVIYFFFKHYVIGQPLTFKMSIKELVHGPVYSHLHFMYIIIGLYIAAPVLAYFAESATLSQKSYFIVLWIIMGSVVPTALKMSGWNLAVPNYVAVDYVGYFVIGRFLCKIDVTCRSLILATAVYVVGAIATALLTYWLTMRSNGTLNEFFYEYGRPNVLLMAVSAFVLINSSAVRKILAESTMTDNIIALVARYSFGLYLVHPIFLYLLYPSTVAWTSRNIALGLMATFAITVICSSLVVWILRRMALTARLVP